MKNLPGDDRFQRVITFSLIALSFSIGNGKHKNIRKANLRNKNRQNPLIN